LKAHHSAAEITEVTRQRVAWQRQAARDLAEGRFGEAVAAYDKARAITWTQDQETARAALVEAWKLDTAVKPVAARFVFAYTNRDVDALNAELRRVRRERGELAGPEVQLETKHAEAAFAVGDRVQFTDTDKKAAIYNGNVGTITGIDVRTGELRATLDSGRAVSWSAAAFPGFRHGYAGTIYKGQGKTLDDTYLYHTKHWCRAASYVALTRQRQSAQVFVARETASDALELARQMARGEIKAASVAWATQDELAVEPARPPEVSEKQAARPEPTRRLESVRDSLNAKVRALLEARQQGEPAPAQPDATPREALRLELRALDRSALREAAHADRVGSAWNERPMTVQDAARLVDPGYAAAADRTVLLREKAGQVEESIRYYEGVLRRGQEQGDQRWREIGFLGQVMHKTGVRRDHALGMNEGIEHMAVAALDTLEPHRAALARELPEAEKVEAAAFGHAQPAAAAELAKRQKLGNLAREIIAERRQEQDQGRERERSRDRDLGMER
ncbi:MAG TPA: hypothetical protein VNW24_10715, partial [Stellaceae bacterium]|nr:hypothetical protein [Stellaceae bacterium]